MNFKNNRGFTLVELIVATFIGAIILTFSLIFINKMLIGLGETKDKTKIMSSYYDFSYKLDNFTDIYTESSIFIDTGSSSDIFLLNDKDMKNGVIFGAVNVNSKKLDADKSIYSHKILGFRMLSESELTLINSDNSKVYELEFQPDLVFNKLKVYDLEGLKFTSPDLYELKISLDNNYLPFREGKKWEDLPKENLFISNIYF